MMKFLFMGSMSLTTDPGKSCYWSKLSVGFVSFWTKVGGDKFDIAVKIVDISWREDHGIKNHVTNSAQKLSEFLYQ